MGAKVIGSDGNSGAAKRVCEILGINSMAKGKITGTEEMLQERKLFADKQRR